LRLHTQALHKCLIISTQNMKFLVSRSL